MSAVDIVAVRKKMRPSILRVCRFLISNFSRSIERTPFVPTRLLRRDHEHASLEDPVASVFNLESRMHYLDEPYNPNVNEPTLCSSTD